MTGERGALVLAGTWTLEPLLPTLEFWGQLLGLGTDVRIAPYAQLFQQLADPGSLLRRNRNGANVLCLRWEDLLPHGAAAPGDDAETRLATRVDETVAALRGFDHVVPCLVLAGPSRGTGDVLAEATAQLRSRLASTPNVSVLDGAEAMTRYRVQQVHDAASDRFGHVPYAPEALAALGTTIVRWHAAHARKPVKVFAVDGDHTLWGGVVGEQGVDGLRIEDGHARLQQVLRAQRDDGRLLCLLSKNEEADVRDVFARHPGMALRWEDLAAHRVDWNAKPGNLQAAMAGLGLGLDSAVFLDDNPVECAQMRAACPAVLTVQVPAEADALADFVDHLWLFDSAAVTDEDRKRADRYRDDASRAELRRGAGSLQDFLDGLELVVEIAAPAPADIPRLAQLTQRTNQFNASLLRLQDHDVLATGDGAFQRSVRARDRFGDYGLVGQVRALPRGDALDVDLFMLSCRALGRGIEHRMLAAAGAHAQSLGLREIVVRFVPGERNTPVRRFLESTFGTTAEAWGHVFRMPAASAAGIVFTADAMPAGDTEAEAGTGAPSPASVPAQAGERGMGSVYERIARELRTGAAIERAIAAHSQPRPELATGFIEPAPGLERDIAAIWRQALRVDAVGAQDPFRELGGKSIHLVQVHRLLLERLGIEVDITTLFQHPTVASLAAHLSSATGAATAALDAAQQRGQRMREAQARAAAARRPSTHHAKRTGA